MGSKCGVLLTLACAACAGTGGQTPIEDLVPDADGVGWDGLDDLVGPNETLIFEIELLRIGER